MLSTPTFDIVESRIINVKTIRGEAKHYRFLVQLTYKGMFLAAPAGHQNKRGLSVQVYWIGGDAGWKNKHESIAVFDQAILHMEAESDVSSGTVWLGKARYNQITVESLRGQHIGTYTYNLLVTWAKNNFPEYDVCPVKLHVSQATEGNRIRRNGMYEKFDLQFDWDDPATQMSGKSRTMKAKALKPLESKIENIDEMPIPSILAEGGRAALENQLQFRLLRNDMNSLCQRLSAANKARVTVTNSIQRTALGIALIVGFATGRYFVPLFS